MYGLVNKAVEELVSSRFGDDAWLAIKRKAGVELDTFASMEAYPDDVTYRLVAAASEVLRLPADEILIAFGEYWVLYTGKNGYGDLMAMAGNTFPSFLQNLDTLHTRVGLSFTELRPPSFRCTEVGPGTLRLHYHSTRKGLAPMVIGLLRGLGKMFQIETEIAHDRRLADGAHHDEFVVRWSP